MYTLPPILNDAQRVAARRHYKWFTIAFKAWVAAFVILFVGAAQDWDTAMRAGSVLLVLSNIAYLYFLAILAAALGKNSFVWAGGALVTGPIGAVVSYVRMDKLASLAGL